MIGKIYYEIVKALESDLFVFNHLIYDNINFQAYWLYDSLFIKGC